MCARPTRRSRSGRRRRPQSYLRRSTRSSTACRQTGAEAVHPGYGFLSENARVRRGAGGGGHRLHRPDAARDRGDGRQDRIEEAGPGGRRLDRARPSRRDRATPTRRWRSPRDIGYPVMIKASAGGGGKGMRIARDDRRRARASARATNEARVQLRRRPGLHREIHRGAAPHRDPGAGRRHGNSSISASANARSSAATRR